MNTMHVLRALKHFKPMLWTNRIKISFFLSICFAIMCHYSIILFGDEFYYKTLKIYKNVKINIMPNAPVPMLYKIEENYYNWETLTTRSSYDDSATYKIISYVKTARNWKKLTKTPVCGAVMSSLDQADSIYNFTASSWKGPASFAIFAPGAEFPLALNYIRHLTVCYPAISEQVSFHLVYPADTPPEHQEELDVSILTNCSLVASKILERLLNLRSDEFITRRKDIQFPYNTLRNVARKHCQTSFIIYTDIDMVMSRPSSDNTPSIMDQLNTFLVSDNATKCDKCAFVIPVFELHNSAPDIPVNKSELLEFMSQNLSRQYHIETWPPVERSSQLVKWIHLPQTDGVKIAYQVEKFEFVNYEPIYIAKRGTPIFDERYLGAGMGRSTQAYETYLAGYKFYVLDNIFLNHFGFKRIKDQTKSRLTEVTKNFELFRKQHVRELAVKYDSDPYNMLKKILTKSKYEYNVTVISPSPYNIFHRMPQNNKNKRNMSPKSLLISSLERYFTLIHFIQIKNNRP